LGRGDGRNGDGAMGRNGDGERKEFGERGIEEGWFGDLGEVKGRISMRPRPDRFSKPVRSRGLSGSLGLHPGLLLGNPYRINNRLADLGEVIYL
jgi:hypothetical protein